MSEPNQGKTERVLAVVRTETKDQGYEFFHDRQRHAWVSVPIRNHIETYPVRSRDFKLLIRQLLFQKFGEARKNIVTACIEQCETHAVCAGPMKPVYVRVATQGNRVYVDLADDEWRVIEITPDGWRVCTTSPVKFHRTQGMLPLPIARDRWNLRDLTKFVNINRKDHVLIFAWLTYVLAGRSAPFPILALNGEHGSGKSTMARIIRALCDPNEADLTTTPRSERDLAIAASKSHLLAFDNLSEISSELSDALCRVATGGSLRIRKLYTDDEEMLFTYCRPVIFNGIEELGHRQDLLDRMITINLNHIPGEKRQGDSLWQEFVQAQPYLLGAVLDTIVAGLNAIGSVSIPNLPRMADFAKWGVAIEQSLGFKDGAFLTAYHENIADASAVAFDSSPITQALQFFLTDDRPVFQGTALQLQSELRQFIESCAGPNSAPKELLELLRHPRFPKSPEKLSGELRRSEPALRKLGIGFKRGKNNRGRWLRLERYNVPIAADMRPAEVTVNTGVNHDATTVQ